MLDWMLPLYKHVGANHPVLSLVGASLLGAIIFGGTWWLAGNEYRERNAIAAPQGALPQVFRGARPETVYFSLGGGGITMGVAVRDLEKSTLLNVNGQVPVKLHLDDQGQLYCDVTIWGGLGNRPPIQVVRNELTVTPPQWDRNVSSNAVEVVNENGLPIFQLIRRDPSHYVMNGIMPLAGGGLILATERGTAVVSGPTLLIPRHALDPIFKYPSWKYPGQYAHD